MVEHWQPNATLNAQVCKNNSGGAYAPWQNQRWDIDSGALYNGQVLPMINTTIKGALWWQGENNVFQCHDAINGNQMHDSGPGGGPLACGSVEDHTGAPFLCHLLTHFALRPPCVHTRLFLYICNLPTCHPCRRRSHHFHVRN